MRESHHYNVNCGQCDWVIPKSTPHDGTHAGKSHGRGGGGGGVNSFGNPDGRGALNLNSIQFNSIQFLYSHYTRYLQKCM